MKNSFGKDIFSGGVANFLIITSQILRSIFVIRLIGVNLALDSYFLGITIIQMFVFNPIKMFVNSGQPNIVKDDRKYINTFIFLGLFILLSLHGILYLFINFIYRSFTSSEDLLNYLHDITTYLFIFSIAQSIFILLTSILKSILNIRYALFIEITGSILITFFLIFLSIKNPIYLLNISSFIYGLLAIISFISIYRNVEWKFILNISWLKKIGYNIRNYLLSFCFSTTTAWYEKYILTQFSAGDLSIFSIVNKAISPIADVLVNPSVLLISFAANSIDRSKELLASYFVLSVSVLTLIVSSVIFVASIGQIFIPHLLNVDIETSSQIVGVFQILSLSIFSSIIYTGFLRFLAAFNKTNYFLYLNIISAVQIILLYTILKQYMLQGIAFAIVINSFLLSAYALLLFTYKLDFKIVSIVSRFDKKMIGLFLFCFLFISFEISNSKLFENSYLEYGSYFIILAGYISQYKKIRGMINNLK